MDLNRGPLVLDASPASTVPQPRQVPPFVLMGHPRPLFRLFWVFLNVKRFLATNKCETIWYVVPGYEHESPAIPLEQDLRPSQTFLDSLIGVEGRKTQPENAARKRTR